MLGYSPDEVEPSLRTWKSLVHPEDWPKLSDVLNGHLEGRLPLFEVGCRTRCKSGEWKWILAQGKIMGHDADGNPLRMTGTTLDITERKLAHKRGKACGPNFSRRKRWKPSGPLPVALRTTSITCSRLLSVIQNCCFRKKEDDPEYADLLKIFQAAKKRRGTGSENAHI